MSMFYRSGFGMGRRRAAAGGGPTSSFDGVFEIRPPTTALFSLSNIGSPLTYAAADGTVYSVRLTNTGSVGTGSNDDMCFNGKTVPAGSSWEAVMGLWTTPFGRAGSVYYRSGLTLLENSTGKSLSIFYNTGGVGGGDPELVVYYMDSLNHWSSAPFVSADIFGGRFPVWFKVAYDGTNYIFSYSLDFMGTWTTAATLAAASYFTADRIGFGLQAVQNVTANENRAEVFYYTDPDY